MEPKEEFRENVIPAVVISVCIYLLLIYLTLFQSSSLSMWDRALGPSPYGINQRLFVFLWITAISLPFPYLFFHTVRAVRFSKREKKGPQTLADPIADYLMPLRGVVDYVQFLLSNADTPPSIRKSKLMTLVLIIYLLGITAAWIVWAASKGI